MLPLVPVSLGLTLLIAAVLFAASSDFERKAVAILSDDMLRHHNAVLAATALETQPIPSDLDAIEQSLQFGPFMPLVDWESAIAEQVILETNGVEVVVGEWILTWPSSFEIAPGFDKDDMAAIPFRLRASGYRNSYFGPWAGSESIIAPSGAPSGGIMGLRLRGVVITEGAPVLANRYQ